MEIRHIKKISSDTPFNIVLPRRGKAVKLSCGQELNIVNTHGTQDWTNGASTLP